MSLSSFVQTHPLKPGSPHYEGLVRFLMEPFLEAPNALKVDCENLSSKSRIWLRVAFEGSDRGRVFGRGGRNIQAIRTVLEAVARTAGQVLYLDIYGSNASGIAADQPPIHRLGSPRSPVNRTRPSKPIPVRAKKEQPQPT